MHTEKIEYSFFIGPLYWTSDKKKQLKAFFGNHERTISYQVQGLHKPFVFVN